MRSSAPRSDRHSQRRPADLRARPSSSDPACCSSGATNRTTRPASKCRCRRGNGGFQKLFTTEAANVRERRRSTTSRRRRRLHLPGARPRRLRSLGIQQSGHRAESKRSRYCGEPAAHPLRPPSANAIQVSWPGPGSDGRHGKPRSSTVEIRSPSGRLAGSSHRAPFSTALARARRARSPTRPTP